MYDKKRRNIAWESRRVSLKTVMKMTVEHTDAEELMLDRYSLKSVIELNQFERKHNYQILLDLSNSYSNNGF